MQGFKYKRFKKNAFSPLFFSIRRIISKFARIYSADKEIRRSISFYSHKYYLKSKVWKKVHCR